MSAALGLGACGLSALLFGSMFVPVRKFDAGDGIFAQWVMSMAILFVGFIVFAIQGFPGFYPLAMVGGACWCIGNATAIPIINRLGMALGILIWNTANCLTGWACGRFGLLGMTARPPANSVLNYIGLVCVLIGGALFSRIKGNPKETPATRQRTVSVKMTESGDAPEKEALHSEKEGKEESDDEGLKEDVAVKAPGGGRIFAFGLSLIAGFLYGITFSPVNYMIDNHDTLFPSHPVDGLDYVFSHYFGIFLTSTALFLGYAIYKKNRPYINVEIALPAYVSGLFWGVAQSSFFVANDNLSQAVSFPIITMLPGCIASAWSIFYFREITGQRNFTILAVAMTITLCGAAMTGLSKTITF